MPPSTANLLISAIQLQQSGRFSEAEMLCQNLLQTSPNHAEAWHFLGILCQQQNRGEESIQHLSRAVAIDPKNAGYWNNLGQAHRSAGNLAEAERAFRQSISCNPNLPAAWINLSLVLSQTIRFSEAIESAKCAIELDYNFAPAHAALGQALSRDDPRAALEAFKQTLHLDPNQPDALNNVGAVLMDLGHYEDALAAFERAVKLAPEFAFAWNNLGICLTRMNRAADGLTCFERAIALSPDFVAAHTNRATAWLLLGDFARGWKEYGWRWAAPPTPEAVPRPMPQPLPAIDDKLDLASKKVLIFTEQGFGDIIHFIRYAELLAERGAEIILADVPSPVVRLLTSAKGVTRVVQKHAEPTTITVQNTNYQANLMSLPMLFGTTLQTIPHRIPYLGPTAEQVRQWRTRIGNVTKLKVGLRWAGNPSHANDFSRTLSPKLLAPLLNQPNVIFYSLQLDRLQSPHENLVDLTEYLTDFSETAGLIANLDLVISVDTSVTHLAGAMAKPTWTLIPFGPEFRWLQTRTDSPWYPTMKLFRQPKLHDWTSVIDNVAIALSKQ
ncbi:MAG TPA: tetratricopeptide repeat-containing glycosyltransferase family protein [Tepidisphaeraceae bacterium]|jgi:tetratricopeptide (TPR) repeat protein